MSKAPTPWKPKPIKPAKGGRFVLRQINPRGKKTSLEKLAEKNK
jgi:hypothetical protein